MFSTLMINYLNFSFSRKAKFFADNILSFPYFFVNLRAELDNNFF